MMLLGPLALGAPWGLLALAGIPAVLAIHWFRRRSPTRTVTGLFLYPPPAPTAASGRRREQIVATPSLWLELFAVLALAWWLTDVYLASDQRGRHVGIVLDDRLRLRATLADGSTPAERIRRQLAARLADLRPVDRVTVIASGAVPRVLAGPAATPEQATAAISAWVPSSPWHELEPATTLMQQILAQVAHDGGDMLVASDRIPHDAPTGIGWIATGEPLAASGLADVRWVRDDAGERLVVRVTVSGAAPVRALEVRAGEAVIGTVPGVAAGTVILPLEPAKLHDAEVLTVSLLGADPLPIDDTVQVFRPPLRVVHITLTLPAGLQALVDRVLHGIPGIAIGPANNATEFVIGTRPETQLGVWSLCIAPTAGSDAALGPFLVRRGHPLARDLDGTGLLWVGGQPRAAQSIDSESLISAGNLVLLSEQRHGRDRMVTLHADPAAGTLAAHPLWPSLIANVIEARRAALPGVVDPNRPAALPTLVVLPPGSTSLSVTAPDGIDTTTFTADTDGAVLLPALRLAGTWQLRLGDARATWKTLNVSTLDERMSDFTTAMTRTIEPTDSALVAVERRRSAAERLVPLILAALAGVLACWFWAKGR